MVSRKFIVIANPGRDYPSAIEFTCGGHVEAAEEFIRRFKPTEPIELITVVVRERDSVSLGEMYSGMKWTAKPNPPEAPSYSLVHGDSGDAYSNINVKLTKG